MLTETDMAKMVTPPIVQVRSLRHWQAKTSPRGLSDRVLLVPCHSEHCSLGPGRKAQDAPASAQVLVTASGVTVVNAGSEGPLA
jgi:hypothetical protein